MGSINRKQFLKVSGLVMLPAVIPAGTMRAGEPGPAKIPADDAVLFFGDGIMYDPAAYLAILQQADQKQRVEKDNYGSGGAVAALEKKFAEITGKERAIFMPTGTMANQFAISELSGANTKIFVQDTSHVYRDEADAAQSVFGKRLMPLAPGEAWFSSSELERAIADLGQQEVFASGVGAVSIENPVRRANGQTVPLEEIKRISDYCRSKKIGLHLDGARIHMASAWTGITVKEYASYFDTVYISLYKYLGAAAGAVLCADEKLISRMPHLMKIHGGAMYGNWTNAAMALNRLKGLEQRLAEVKDKALALFSLLNRMEGVKVKRLDGGTNIHGLALSTSIDGKKLQDILRQSYNIRIPRPNASNQVNITLNETLLRREIKEIGDAFRKALEAATI